MGRRTIALLRVILTLISLSSVTIVKAQAPTWTAWLYDYDHGVLMYIDNTLKAPTSLTLPLPPTSKPSYNVILSPDTQYVVYTGTDTQETLYIYSRSQQKVVYQSPAQGRLWGLSTIGDSGIFDETGNRLAVGYTDAFSFYKWGIDIINLNTGIVETSLTQTSRGAQSIQALDIPTVRRFRNGEVAFTFILIPDVDSPPQVTYQWNITSGKLARSGAYPSNVDADTYDPTGETISAFPDARLPNCGCVCSAMGTPSNALSVYDPTTKMHFPFFTAADATFLQPIFGEDGQLILVTAQGKASITALLPSSLPGPKYEFKMGTKTTWVVSRAGRLVGKLSTELPVLQLQERGFGRTYIGWQSGFLYLSNTSAKISLVNVNTLTGLANMQFTGSVVWETPENMHLVFIPSPSTMTFKGPFTAWTKLNPPLSGAVFPPLSNDSFRHPGCP